MSFLDDMYYDPWDDDEDYDDYDAGWDLYYKEQRIWVTGAGEAIPVAEMDTDHIQNCLNYLKREDGDPGWIEIFKAELVKRVFGEED